MAFDKLNGFYRGTVLQHMSNGMCKVFVYGVYPDDWSNRPEMLPPAEQASPLFAGANLGNGVFSYPNVGATVWCFFANGDQNYPVYFAATLGGQSASMRWNEARSNVTGENIANGDDAYIHKIDVNKSTIKIWESGYIEVLTRSVRKSDDSEGSDESGSDNPEGGGEDYSKVTIDGKGNIVVTTTQQLQVTAPSINVKAEDRLTLAAPTIKVEAGSMLDVVSPVYSNITDTAYTVKAPSIDMDASKGMAVVKGKRHSSIIC